jgi:hypothetical protein
MSLTDDYLAAAITRAPLPSAIRAAVDPKLDATTYLGRCLSRSQLRFPERSVHQMAVIFRTAGSSDGSVARPAEALVTENRSPRRSLRWSWRHPSRQSTRSAQ